MGGTDNLLLSVCRRHKKCQIQRSFTKARYHLSKHRQLSNMKNHDKFLNVFTILLVAARPRQRSCLGYLPNMFNGSIEILCYSTTPRRCHRALVCCCHFYHPASRRLHISFVLLCSDNVKVLPEKVSQHVLHHP